MEYINHINKYDNSAAIQAALNEGSLGNPYVAVKDDTGEVDYNTLSPEEPCHLGEWSDNGAGTYTFQILEPGDAVWENGVNIGSLMNVYFNGGQDTIDMDVTLATRPGTGVWTMNFVADPEESYNPLLYSFDEEVADTWESGVMTNPHDSDAVITVGWDGTDTFMLQTDDLNPLSMTTINPECSE